MNRPLKIAYMDAHDADDAMARILQNKRKTS